jgi:ATP-binding cassette subfamily B protein
VLLTTNRPGAIALADQVVLVRAGRVVATGTPAELADVEEYRRIVTAYEASSVA